MKKVLGVILVAVFASTLMFSGCSKEKDTKPTKPTATAPAATNPSTATAPMATTNPA